MDKFELIYNKINKASKIGIVTHINPDGDAIGTALALWRVLSLYGKECDCLCDGELPIGYKGLPFSDFFGKPTIDKYDLMISVDVSTSQRCGKYAVLFDKCDSASIDHHEGRESFAKVNFVELSSSTAELVFRFVKRFYPEYITKEVAELLYVGLITDCGGFAYEYVNSNSLQTGAELLKYGINNSELYRKYLNEKPLSLVKLSSYVISKAIYELGGKVAFLVFTKDDLDRFGCSLDQTSGVLADILKAEEVKVAIGLTEVNNNSFKVSVRSKGEVNAIDIVSEFGGGGHKNAAGCRVNGELGIVLDMLTFAVHKNLD